MIKYIFLFLINNLIAQGSIMLVGGGGEGYGSWSDQPYSWFVEKADSGKIINIDVDETSDWYPTYFISLGADLTSRSLQISSIEDANNFLTYQELLSADGIFIEGGDQWDYIATWKNTYVQTAIEFVYNNGGVIGGNSAGMAILGEVVFDAEHGSLTSDQAAYNPYHYRLSLTDDFLSLLSNVITDSHFNERGRLGRLIVMLARRSQDFEQDLLGIGVEYKTAFCIDENMVGEVHGEMVTIISKTDSSDIQCAINEPPRFTNIAFNQLLDGSQFNIETREMVEDGFWLNPYEPEMNTTPFFHDITLNGSEDSIANFGEIIVTGLTSEINNWWYGDLEIEDGSGLVPHTAIIPRIWSDYDYFPNRIIGGEFALVTSEENLSDFQNRPFITLFLDDNCVATISEDGILTAGNVTYVLDVFSATHIGTNSDNMPGIVNGALHFLINGDLYDLRSNFDSVSNYKEENSFPYSFYVKQNYPNPFNPRTFLQYYLPKELFVKIIIYDILGNKVNNLFKANQSSGHKFIQWDAMNNQGEPVSAGIYLYSIEAGNFKEIRKMILLK